MFSNSISGLIAIESAKHVFREKTVSFLSVIFIALVVVSAYLGWSATHTVNAIYLDATQYLKTAGHAIPPNPILDISPLSLLRNMSIYVLLIGALAAIVIGFSLIEVDRKSGVMPLLGSRPFHQGAYARGKILALATVLFGLMFIAALVSVLTFLLLPEFRLDGHGWLKFTAFFLASYGYMLFFGFIATASAAWAKSEAVGLILPVTVWLTLTFILPSLTSNIHPTAAINPISALAPPPDSSFFQWMGWVIGPVSIAEAFKYLSADFLDFLPSTATFPSFIPPGLELLIAIVLAGAVSMRAMLHMDVTRGDYDA